VIFARLGSNVFTDSYQQPHGQPTFYSDFYRMPLFIASLNSGSNGNCYYVGTGEAAILVDAGLSCRETEKRMARLGLNMALVKAIFISHEHSDHIRGVEVLSKKHRLPVYITPRTLRGGGLLLHPELIKEFKPFEPVEIDGLNIIAFPKFHDAVDPHSFVISANGVNVGVFTDIGKVCNEVIHHFKHCHAVFLESNYDEEMLATGHYPLYLKRRIKGGEGHLSNAQALELFVKHRTPHLKQILLSHLSRDNNDPAIAEKLFMDHAGQVTVTVASRDQETEVFRIKVEEREMLRPMGNRSPAVQISLF
jgi:phosphoribosyl 1,2-cyclic phosphodiesterase